MTATAAPEARTIRNRGIKTDLPIGKNAEGHDIVATVYTCHSRESKALVCILSRETVKPSATPGIRFATFRPMDSVRLITFPIVRYSDKALAAVHDDAVDLVEQLRSSGDNAKVNAIFAPAL